LEWSSAKVSVSLPISNTNLADGYHTIKVIGRIQLETAINLITTTKSGY
jgi:hypothetical protein